LAKRVIDSSEFPSDLIRRLVKTGFLVSPEYREQGILDQIREQFLSRPSYNILYLLLTDACNLRCRYCVIEGSIPLSHKFLKMKKETAEKGIELFAELNRHSSDGTSHKRAMVIFYGGEPLLNKPVFLHAVDKIEACRKSGFLPEQTRITVITNGTIMDDEIIALCKVYDVGVSFSIDGPEVIHDAQRVTTGGKGTFEKVLANFRRCQEAGLNPAVSCTINPSNLEVLPQVMSWLIEELGIKGMGFNLLLDLPHLTQSNEEYVSRATDGILKSYELAREHGVYEDRVMRKVKAFVSKRLHLVDCGGCGHQIVVTPDGKVGPCHMYLPSGKNFSTTVWNTGYDFFNSGLFLEWAKRSPINIPQCWKCPALGSCGGGCLYNAELKQGNIWKPDPEFCIHSKMVLEWLVWDLFRQETQLQPKEVIKDEPCSVQSSAG